MYISSDVMLALTQNLPPLRSQYSSGNGNKNIVKQVCQNIVLDIKKKILINLHKAISLVELQRDQRLNCANETGHNVVIKIINKILATIKTAPNNGDNRGQNCDNHKVVLR